MWKQKLYYTLVNNFVLFVILFLVIKIGETQEIKLRNPFKSWFYIKAEEDKQKELEKLREEVSPSGKEKMNLQLKGILTGKRNLAVINDEILGEGDVIEGRRIVKIEKKKVILEEFGGKKEIILELSDEP